MSQESSTVEIDPDELSEEVMDSLMEETDLDEGFARQKAERVQLDEMNTGETNERSLLGISGSYASKGFGWVSDKLSVIKNKKTAIGTISEVEPTKSGVKLTVSHPQRSSVGISLDKKSTELANLMKYHNVSTPAELVDKSLSMKYVSDASPCEKMHKSFRPTYCIPHNVSLFGRFQYKMFSGLQQWREKTIWWSDDPFDTGYFAIIGGLLISMIGLGMSIGFEALSESIGTPIISGSAEIMQLVSLSIALSAPAVLLYILNAIFCWMLYYVLRGKFYEN